MHIPGSIVIEKSRGRTFESLVVRQTLYHVATNANYVARTCVCPIIHMYHLHVY